jgi:hypothetical protein
MHTKSGKLEDRLSPWAKFVTREEKVPVYDQIFWDPKEVCGIYNVPSQQYILKMFYYEGLK